MKIQLIVLMSCLISMTSLAQVNYPPPVHENGFIVLDVLTPQKYTSKQNTEKVTVPIMRAQDLEQVRKMGLEPYRPLFKFNAPAKANDSVEPWLGKDLDVTRPQDAELVAKILQRYVFEGWFAGKDLEKNDTHFRDNDQRTWCQTPWLNISEKGREAIHGLTKEFPIRSTTIYTVPQEVEDKEQAVTWGLSFFNQKVCQSYKDFFKEKNMIEQIRTKKPLFEAQDGAVSFKLLFNAMKNWRSVMPQWEGAYNWTAHVSHARQNDLKKDGDESLRELLNIPLVQIDIGLRDSRLKGTRSDLKNWVMTSYYYDKNYTNEFLADMKIPEALKHMRPIGLQYGLEAGETVIFPGSDNNHRPGYNQGDRTELSYDKTRLNGPVDNTVSSCLGCHAQSGINFGLPDGQKVSGAGLGFLNQQEYARFSQQVGQGGFDFNMQVDKAMRNFALSKKQKINGPAPVK